MATHEQIATLQHFVFGEFRHPELCDFAFLQWLDYVREEYGFPMILTSDARTPQENNAASGSAPNSRHLVGQAVDIAFPPTSNHLWLLVAAVMKKTHDTPVELEIVHGIHDAHVHIAWLPLGRAHSLEVALT